MYAGELTSTPLTGLHTPEGCQIDKDTVALEAEKAALLDYYHFATLTVQAAIRQFGCALTEPGAQRGRSGKR